MNLPRLSTLLIWLAVGASAVTWFLPGLRSVGAGAPPASVVADSPVPPGDWSRLWASTVQHTEPAALPAEAARYRLLGVAGPLPGGAVAAAAGVALLSIDGGPPRALRSGEALDAQRIVLEITAHEVRIGPRGGPATVVLQAPRLAPPATRAAP